MSAEDTFYRAMMLKEAGELAKSATAFKQALRGKLGDSQYLALDNYSEVLQGLERYKELDDVASTTIKLVARESRGSTPAALAWTRKAIALQHLGQLGKAIDAVDRALAIDSTSATAHYEKACILAAGGQSKEAMTSAKKALRFDRSLLKEMRNDDDLASLRALPEGRALLGSGRGKAAARKASFPKIPARLEDTFALLASNGVPLPRARAGSIPKGLPRPLAAFYRHASRLPSTATDAVTPAGQQAKLTRAFARALDAEEDHGEGLPRSAFSATARLIAFGSPDNGGYYFLDPRYGDVVFTFAHDEMELRAEAATFGAFVALHALEAWAAGEGLEDAYTRAVEKERAAARKRVRTKWPRKR